MELKLDLLLETKDSTLSRLSVGNEFICYILEDGFRATKVPGVTRIPAGRYKLEKVYQGRFFEAYKRKFSFPFALGLKDVPNFSLIRIHCGNVVGDSDGCLLTGTSFKHNTQTKTFEVGKSQDAYQKLWRKISSDMVRDSVWITISREMLTARPGQL